jgi:hypothetical protein
MHVVVIYLALLGATLLIELPLAAGLAGRGKRREVSTAALLLNLLTHPVATAMVWRARASWLPTEIAVAVAEALGFCALTSLGPGRATCVALVINLASAAAGAALSAAWRAS